MKTRSLLLIIAVVFSTALSAQRFQGGILAGLNASQVDGDSWGGYYKTGLLLGAFVNTEFRNNFGGQLEIKFSGKGSANYPKSPIIQKIKLNYIDLPILVTYKTIDALKLEGGISINYLFKAEYYDDDWMDNWILEPNKLETAIVFGVNYTFFQNFDINARYSYSLFPVRSFSSSSNFSEGAWFNNVLSFALYFHLGRFE
jgi:hypothetical protein